MQVEVREGMTDLRLLTVIVPVFNERETLRPAIERLLKTELPLPVEIIVVDDGSVDGSIDTVADLVQESRIRLMRHRSNRGKGAAVRTGLACATGEVATVLDADLEYDPTNYRTLLHAMSEDGAEVVYGTRSFGSHTAYSFWYVIGNKLLAFWANLLFNVWLSDIETCFKMAPVGLWHSLNIRSQGFGIEAEVTAKLLRGGHRIYEVPIDYRARGREEGKKLHATDGLQALWILLRVRLFGR